MIWPEMVVREARRRLEAATWTQMVEGCFQIARNSTKPKKIQKKNKKYQKSNPSSSVCPQEGCTPCSTKSTLRVVVESRAGATVRSHACVVKPSTTRGIASQILIQGDWTMRFLIRKRVRFRGVHNLQHQTCICATNHWCFFSVSE